MSKKLFGTAVLTALLAMGVCGFATSAMAAGEKGTEYEWSIELDCAECHQKEYVSMGLMEAEEAEEEEEATEAKSNVTVEFSEEELAHLAEVTAYGPMHAENFGLTCIGCHEDSDELAAAHKKLNSGKEAKRLKKSEVSSEICLTCHKVEDLAKTTAEYVALVDGKGTVVNPHDIPVNESHESVACLDCHTMHSGKPIQEAAMTTCLSCHHAGVFECGTCHN